MTEVPKSDDLPAVIEAPKRSCLGCAFKGGLGCGAFFLGVMVILGVFGPNWVAGWVAVSLRDEFNQDHAGSIDGFEFDFSWKDRQHLRGLRLLDPEGEVVLVCDVELPGALDLLEQVGEPQSLALGRIQCDVTGQIVADETGLTNLERALERTHSRPEFQGDRTVTINGRSPAEARADFMTAMEFVFDLKSSSLTFSSPQSEALGAPIELRNLEARLRARPDGGSWTITADADVVSEEEGRLDLSLTAWEPDWYKTEWMFGVVSGEVDITGFSTGLLDGLLGQNGRLVQTLGNTLNIDLDVNDVTAHKGSVRFGLDSDHQDLTLEGHFAEGAFRMDQGEQFSWNIEAPRSLIESLASEALPEGMRVELLQSDRRWLVELTDLVVPVLGTASEDGGRLARMLSGASFKARFEPGSAAFEREGLSPLHLSAPVVLIEQGQRGLTANVDVMLESEAQGPLGQVGIELRPRNVWEFLLAEGRVPSWSAGLTLKELELAELLRMQGVEDDRIDLLMGRFEGGVEVRNGLGLRAQVAGHLNGDALRVTLVDLWTDETHLARSEDLDLLIIEPSNTLVSQLIADSLPDGIGVVLQEETQRLVVEQLELPRVAPGSFEIDLQTLTTRLRVEVAPMGITLEGHDEVVLSSLRGVLVCEPQSSPRFELDAGLRDHPTCAMQLKLTSAARLEELLEAEELASVLFALDAKATDVPSSLVDTLAKQDGLVVDVLGPNLDLECSSEALNLDSGALSVHLSSEHGTLDWSGELRDGVLHSEGEDHLEAKIGLSPIFSERVIGSLIPFLVQASKEEGADPLSISMNECSLPLGGDLSQLNGKLSLDLGAIQYRVLPQLEDLLGKTTRLKSSVIAPIEIDIVNGLATYENFAVEVGDKHYAFKGSIELASEALNFETEIPLGNLGDRVGKKVQRLVRKGLISPDVAVPVTLRGTVDSPKVGLRDGFLESLTGGLLPGSLDDTVKGLFDKLLGDD